MVLIKQNIASNSVCSLFCCNIYYDPSHPPIQSHYISSPISPSTILSSSALILLIFFHRYFPLLHTTYSLSCHLTPTPSYHQFSIIIEAYRPPEPKHPSCHTVGNNTICAPCSYCQCEYRFPLDDSTSK